MKMPANHTPLAQGRSGFTILELLISVIIIGILVAIIIPVYSARAEQARYAAALQDIENLARANEHAAIDTGYFYRLYVLDDTKFGDGVIPTNLNDRIDGIRDEEFRTDVTNPKLIFIDTNSGDILAAGAGIYDRLVANETNFNFNGPYINISKKWKATDPATLRPVGQPIDPWQNPYLLFTKAGLVKEPDGVIATTYLANDSNSYNALVFDRPTMLSLGPNGLPGNGITDPNANKFGQGDDIIKQF